MYYLSTLTAGPAERAGVRNGDKLIWVNGVTVANLTFSALNKIVCIYVGYCCCAIYNRQVNMAFSTI
jgi:hypothetical protein